MQVFFTEIKSLPKFQLRVDGVWMPLALPKFSPHRNGEFSLYRKLYATEIKVDYSMQTLPTMSDKSAICLIPKKALNSRSLYNDNKEGVKGSVQRKGVVVNFR